MLVHPQFDPVAVHLGPLAIRWYGLMYLVGFALVWEGGICFHGGFLGVIIALWWYARSRRQSWLAITDFIAPLAPLGLGAGRLGNFINAELWGRAASVPWATVFPTVDRVPRHPSQLYEFALEGVVLFVV